ncbi:hypothetical protein GGI43DRAFT_384256 [Trichoderma evansii]
MSQITPFCVYIHGCPGFLNATICNELSHLINDSQVLKIGVNPNDLPHRAHLRSSSPSVEKEILLYLRYLLVDTLKDSKRHSWIFSDFRGAASINSTLPVEEFEIAADKMELPFIHVILRCNPQKVRSLSVVGESLRNTNAVDFAVFESIRKKNEIRASGKSNELELDITDLDPAEAAGRIFMEISRILHF